MEQIESSSEIIKEKLRANFDGKIVRKDLTKKIKEGANVPVYVLEFLLGQYCSSDDPEIVENGVQTVKRILADNFVRPDEAQKILSVLRKKGSHRFTLDDGTENERTILSGVHAFYEPEELVGKTLLAIVNLPPRSMMGIDSCGMLLSAIHNVNGEEKLNLVMLDDAIPAGAKLY